MKSFVSLALCGALALLSPGLEAYAAAGRALEGTGENAAPAIPAGAAAVPYLAPADGLPRGAETIVTGLPDSPQAPEAVGVPAGAEAGAVARLATSQPGSPVERSAPKAREKGFLRRMGLGPSLWLQRKRMPESDDDLGEPRPAPGHDGTGDLDEIGNPRRDDRDHGPDSREEGFQLKKRERMPEREGELDETPRPAPGHDGAGDLDEIGNPRRDDRDHGPDSRDAGLAPRPRVLSPRASAVMMGLAMTVLSFPAHLDTAGHLLLTGLSALSFAGLGALGFPALASGAALLGIVTAAAPIMGVLAAAPPAAHGPIPPDSAKRVEYVVVLKPGARGFAQDSFLSSVDVSARGGVDRYRKLIGTMTSQLDAAGVPGAGLSGFGATPVATYKRINAATISVDAARADQLKAWLVSRGHRVFDNARREIVRPVPVSPEQMDPSRWGPVTMDENMKIMRADGVQKIAEHRFGKPGAGVLGRLLERLTGVETAPAVRAAVIDTGIDGTHPMLKGIPEKNVTSVASGDDDGHGSWTQSALSRVAAWAKPHATHYKTFVKGGATLDDILKALTMAANDGNLVISNSWGDDTGDPNSPDSQLVRKLAEEGHIMVFAAGNAGSGSDTIGNPAIVQYRDPKTKAIRVLSVAAADGGKRIAFFSSRGDRSPMTRDDAGVAAKPDLTAVGMRVEAAWPDAFGPDRVDPVYGPVKAENGTSMSTPSVAGAIVLLCLLFGVTQKGEKLDAIVNAVMDTLENTGQGHAAEGDGFINVEAAYRKLEKTLGAPASRMLGAGLFGALMGQGRWASAPTSAVLEYGRLLERDDAARARERELRLGRRVYDDDVDPAADREDAQARDAMTRLETSYPELRALYGLRGRLWLAARGL